MGVVFFFGWGGGGGGLCGALLLERWAGFGSAGLGWVF